MEAIGQGVIYSSFGETRRQLPDEEVARRMEIYHRYLDSFKSLIADDAIIVDCHSFPERLAPDVDFCIGFNDDESKPDDKIINNITHLIRKVDIGSPSIIHSPTQSLRSGLWPTNPL